MIEEEIVQYLSKTLDVSVSTDMPAKVLGRFVLVEKTGSSKENYINSATIALQSYAENTYKAAELNEAVKEAMENIVVHTDISKSKLNSDYNYTDTTKKQYRYQAVYEVIY